MKNTSLDGNSFDLHIRVGLLIYFEISYYDTRFLLHTFLNFLLLFCLFLILITIKYNFFYNIIFLSINMFLVFSYQNNFIPENSEKPTLSFIFIFVISIY